MCSTTRPIKTKQTTYDPTPVRKVKFLIQQSYLLCVTTRTWSQVRMVDGSEYNVPVPEGVAPGGRFIAHFPVQDMQEVNLNPQHFKMSEFHL